MKIKVSKKQTSIEQERVILDFNGELKRVMVLHTLPVNNMPNLTGVMFYSGEEVGIISELPTFDGDLRINMDDIISVRIPESNKNNLEIILNSGNTYLFIKI